MRRTKKNLVRKARMWSKNDKDLFVFVFVNFINVYINVKKCIIIGVHQDEILQSDHTRAISTQIKNRTTNTPEASWVLFYYSSFLPPRVITMLTLIPCFCALFKWKHMDAFFYLFWLNTVFMKFIHVIAYSCSLFILIACSISLCEYTSIY